MEARPHRVEDPAAREKHRREREARRAAEKEKEKERAKKDKELKRKREEEDRQRQKRLDWIPMSSSGMGAKLRELGEFMAPYSFSNALPEVPSGPKPNPNPDPNPKPEPEPNPKPKRDPNQGAIGIQIRENDEKMSRYLGVTVRGRGRV